MKKWLLVPAVVVIFTSILLSGCAGGGVPADYEQVKSELAATKATVAALAPQVAGLSVISAYNIWYDQYYGVYNYQFADTATFRKEMSNLITAANDAATKTAWDAYIVTVKALDDVVASLPADSTTWNTDEYNKWLEAYNASWADFGKVGTALYNAAHYSASQVRILELQAQVAGLSAVTAYNMWYDQYYEIYAYVFADRATFHTRLGTLIYATKNNASETAWYNYLQADTALTDILTKLPEDYKTWTDEQTKQWSDANTARTNALGAVGTALFNAISGYTEYTASAQQ